jgi:hypothetical protein
VLLVLFSQIDIGCPSSSRGGLVGSESDASHWPSLAVIDCMQRNPTRSHGRCCMIVFQVICRLMSCFSSPPMPCFLATRQAFLAKQGIRKLAKESNCLGCGCARVGERFLRRDNSYLGLVHTRKHIRFRSLGPGYTTFTSIRLQFSCWAPLSQTASSP